MRLDLDAQEAGVRFVGTFQCICCRPSPTCALVEFRKLRTSEGRKAAMEEYRDQLRHRAALLNGDFSRARAVEPREEADP